MEPILSLLASLTDHFKIFELFYVSILLFSKMKEMEEHGCPWRREGFGIECLKFWRAISVVANLYLVLLLMSMCLRDGTHGWQNATHILEPLILDPPRYRWPPHNRLTTWSNWIKHTQNVFLTSKRWTTSQPEQWTKIWLHIVDICTKLPPRMDK